jgi:hypothetical protein
MHQHHDLGLGLVRVSRRLPSSPVVSSRLDASPMFPRSRFRHCRLLLTRTLASQSQS